MESLPRLVGDRFDHPHSAMIHFGNIWHDKDTTRPRENHAVQSACVDSLTRYVLFQRGATGFPPLFTTWWLTLFILGVWTSDGPGTSGVHPARLPQPSGAFGSGRSRGLQMSDATEPKSRPKRCTCYSYKDKECVYYCHLDIIWINTPE